MFVLRSSFPTDEEVSRQTTVWRVLQKEREMPLTTLLERKAAAICQHTAISPIIQAKVLKRLPDILNELSNDNNDDDILERLHNCAKLQARVVNVIRETRIRADDAIILPVRPPIFSYTPQAPRAYDFYIESCNIEPVTLFEFERMAFDGNVQYRFYEGTRFATYFYQNAKHMLIGRREGNGDNNNNDDALIGNERWQARLSVLLSRTGFSDAVATSAFHDDKVYHAGVAYDTSFVPKYNVRAIKPIVHVSEQLNSKSSQNMIEYHTLFDPRNVKRIPNEYMPVFRTFPFKAGHRVRPDGTVAFLDLPRGTRQSSALLMNQVCSAHDVEAAINDAARLLRIETVIEQAAYARTVHEQGIALLVLRQMSGLTVRIDEENIVSLPTMNEVLSWTAPTCRSTGILLPKPSSSDNGTVQQRVSLVQSIAESCVTKLGASFVCSNYHIPEYDLRNVYDALRTDAEKYVFLTILIQQYDVNMYRKARDRLNPIFGSQPVSFETTNYENGTFEAKYESVVRQFHNSSVQDRVESNTVPLIMPTDVIDNSRMSCPPYRCVELYRFHDEQLNALVSNEQFEFDDTQLAAFVALCIKRSYNNGATADAAAKSDSGITVDDRETKICVTLNKSSQDERATIKNLSLATTTTPKLISRNESVASCRR